MDWAVLLSAAIAAVPATIAALAAWRNARAANRAVNSRPPSDPSIYDMVRITSERLSRVEGMIEVLRDR